MIEYIDGQITDESLEFIKKGIKDDKNRHSNYAGCCAHAEDMSIHVYGVTPTKLLEITRPNEDPEIKKYRLSVYQPKTKSTANKALSILYKMFNPSQFRIIWPESSNSKKLEEYSMEYYPVYNSVLCLLQETITPKMIADPNGVIVVRPKTFDFPDTERAEPLIFIYGSSVIWSVGIDHCLVLKKFEEEKKVKRYFFEFYNNEVIVDFVVEKSTSGDISIINQEEYVHGCKTMPVWQLRGSPEAQDDGSIVYKSFFEPAIPYWNDAIGHESDLKGAFQNHIHPLRYEYDEECTHRYQGQPCKRGTITLTDGKSMACPNCGGTGYKGAANSPYRIIRINRDKTPGNQDNIGFPVPAGFITVPTEPTDLLDKYVDKQHLKGLEALNMDVVDKIGENQSGIAKVIDRGELFDFLSRIATVVFDVHLTNIFYYFNCLMFGVTDGDKKDKNLPSVVKPVQFDISSTFELVEQLSAAKKAGVNPNYLKAAQNEIIEKKFTDPGTRQNLQLILENDPLPDYEPDVITMLQSGGTYKQTDVVIHFNIAQFIKRALAEKGENFIKADKTEKKKILEAYASELIKATKDSIKLPEPVTD